MSDPRDGEPKRTDLLAQILAWSWLASLIALALGLRLVGERWWPLAFALYLPRALFGLPLLLMVGLGIRHGMRRLWLPIAGAVGVLVFPLMGLVLSHPRALPEQQPRLRILSYNVWYGHFGAAAIVSQIDAAHADVVTLQAYDHKLSRALREHLPDWQIHEDEDFFLASRFPISDVSRPPLFDDPEHPKPGFRRYTLDTPIGRVALFATHPDSPRDAVRALRDRDRDLPDRVSENATIRRAQVAALSQEAARSTLPTIIAGDTNLPTLSPMLHDYLGRYQDGFASAGSGFGYTFPANRLRPWMRIDRVMVSDELRVTRFEVGSRVGSDHCPVIAEVAWRR